MANILIYSNNPHLTAHWTHALIGENSVNMLPNINGSFAADIVLLDAQKLDEDQVLWTIFVKHACRFLVIGTDWAEHKQIEAVAKGAAGYCEANEAAEIIKRAINCIVAGDIWVQRCLVPKIIAALTTTKRSQGSEVKAANIAELLKTFETLSVREVEVANMIQVGESNKRIAGVLNISERTVKAHLSSIFRKLEVEDRLQLAIFLKEIEQFRKTV